MKKTPSWLAVAFVLSTSGMLHATNWYVDPAAAGANNGTSWANAWTSFSKIAWSSVAPGDTIYLSGGTTSQTYTTPLSIGKSGTSGAPITIAAGQDAGHNGMVIFDGSGGTSPMINVGGQNYVTVDGNYQGLKHIVVQNNSQSASGTALISAYGNASTSGVGNTLRYVEVKHSGDGINFLYQVSGVIANSFVHDISCDHAIGLAGSAIHTPAYDAGVTIHHTTIQVNNGGNNTGSGPDAIQGTFGNTVHDNVLQGVAGTMCASPNHQDGIQMGGSYYKIYNNSFYGLANSSMDSDWNNTDPCGFLHVWNNVFSETISQSNSGGIWVGQQPGCNSVNDVRIYNNVFADYQALPAVYVANASAVPILNSAIQNNIFYNDNHPVQIGPAGSWTCGVNVIISNNNVNAGPHGGTTITCGSSAYSEPNHQPGAPQFVTYTQFGASNNDYHLLSTSTPDLGTGVNLSNWFATDKDGVTLPPTGAWDVGPYDPNSSNSGGVTPPTGLNAVVQ